MTPKKSAIIFFLIIFSSVVVAKPLEFFGLASWYGKNFTGRKTASGQKFDHTNPHIIAHRTLPFGTLVEITNLTNGLSLWAKVVDRGPFHGKRIADLSEAGAIKLGFRDAGITKVKIEVKKNGEESNGKVIFFEGIRFSPQLRSSGNRIF